MENLPILPNNRDEARKVLKSYIDSRLLPAHIRTVDQAEVIVGIGKEIGLPPIASLRTILIINGMPTVSPAMMIALANKRGLIEDMKIEKSEDRAIVTILKKGRKTPHVEVFTKDDAGKLGLLEKDNYKKQIKTMLTWRAISAAMRAVFPEVLFGLYTPEEIGAVIDIDPENELEGKVREVPQQQKTNSIDNKKLVEQVMQIKERLAIHYGDDLQKMNSGLMLLTEYYDKALNGTAFIQIDQLDELIETKPRWIQAILEKMDKNGIGLRENQVDPNKQV